MDSRGGYSALPVFISGVAMLCCVCSRNSLYILVGVRGPTPRGESERDRDRDIERERERREGGHVTHNDTHPSPRNPRL